MKQYSRRMQSVVVHLERNGWSVSRVDELTTFEQNLKPEIQRHLRSSVKQASSLKEAVAAAEAFEEAEKLFHTQTHNLATTLPVPSTSSVHILRNTSLQADMQRMTTQLDLPSQQRWQRPYSTRPTPSPFTRAPTLSRVMRNACNGYGHLARECPSKPRRPPPPNTTLTCYECHGFGHYGRDCP